MTRTMNMVPVITALARKMGQTATVVSHLAVAMAMESVRPSAGGLKIPKMIMAVPAEAEEVEEAACRRHQSHRARARLEEPQIGRAVYAYLRLPQLRAP